MKTVFPVLALLLVSCSTHAKNTTQYKGIECVSLGNEHTELYVNAHDYSLVGLRNRGKGVDMVLEPGSPLFCVSFWQPKLAWYTTEKVYSSTGTDAAKRRFEHYEEGSTQYLKLHYEQCRVTELETADFVVTISIEAHQRAFRWNLEVRTPGVPVYEVKFPTLMGLGIKKDTVEADDYLVLPIFSGQRNRGLRKLDSWRIGQGLLEAGSMGMSVEVMCYTDPSTETSLYLAAEDKDQFSKTFCVKTMKSRESFGWYSLHYGDGLEKNGYWKLPYNIATGVLEGDWYDVAKEYREWIKKCGRFTPNSEKEIPEWIKNNNVWFQGEYNLAARKGEVIPQAFLDKLKDIRKRIGEPYAFHWYLWWASTPIFDLSHPDVLPPRGDFRSAVAELKETGIHPVTYINCAIMDVQTDMWKNDKAEQWASRTSTGDYYRMGAWKGKKKNTYMCPSTDYWQDKMVHIQTTLIEKYGVDGVYFDQLYVFPHKCHATNHNHRTVGGNHFIGSYRDILERVRKESGQPDIVMTGEGCGEAYADLVTAQLNGHCDIGYGTVPLFQTVMRDYTMEFGWLMMPGEVRDINSFAAKLGFAFVRGRQLGWFNLNYGTLLESRYDEQVEFLKRICAARSNLREFMLYGELLRMPELVRNGTHVVKWCHKHNGRAAELSIPDVLCAAYKKGDGTLALLLVNITKTPQECAIRMNEKDWGVRMGDEYDYQVYENGHCATRKRIPLPAEMDVSLPPLSSLAVVLRVE